MSRAIYLTDDTIAHNLSFGLPTLSINQQAVRRVAAAAQTAECLGRQLRDGEQTLIGGQAARLYSGAGHVPPSPAPFNGPQVLIRDEVIHVLDDVTEEAFMQGIHPQSHEVTLIVNALRFGTCEQGKKALTASRRGRASAGRYNESMGQGKKYRNNVGPGIAGRNASTR